MCYSFPSFPSLIRCRRLVCFVCVFLYFALFFALICFAVSTSTSDCLERLVPEMMTYMLLRAKRDVKLYSLTQLLSFPSSLPTSFASLLSPFSFPIYFCRDPVCNRLSRQFEGNSVGNDIDLGELITLLCIFAK